jgi:hypothetical protein
MGINCGVDCSTAALYSWKNAGGLSGMSDTTLNGYNTKSMVIEATRNIATDKIKMAGSYATKELSDSTLITKNLSLTQYKTMMGKLQTGDIAVYRSSSGGHAVVFTGFAIDGSGITYIDIGQGSVTFPAKSMWSEGTMSYVTLQSKGYIPITNAYFKSFSYY